MHSFLFLTLFLGVAFSARPDGLPESVHWFNTWDEAKSQAAELKQIVVVLVTKEWCGACKSLKSSLNNVHELPLFEEAAQGTTLLSITDDSGPSFISDVQYVPRVYFVKPDGSSLEGVQSPNPKFPRFFPNAQVLAAAIKEAKAQTNQGQTEL